MPQFSNIQEALNFPLGQIEGAKSKVTIGDYLDIIDSSNAFRRLLTQFSLYFSGKGWVNQAKAQKMIKTVDLETLNSVTNICKRIITRLSETKLVQRDPIGLKLSKKEEQAVLRGIESLGDHHIDSSIQTVIKEMQLLRGWVGEERISRHQHLLQLMGNWNVEQFEKLRKDREWKKVFAQYIKWAKEWGHDHPPGSLGEAVKILNSDAFKQYYTSEHFDLDKLDTSNMVIRVSILTITSGFEDWLAYSLETGSFGKKQKKSIVNKLCKLNPVNAEEIRKSAEALP